MGYLQQSFHLWTEILNAQHKKNTDRCILGKWMAYYKRGILLLLYLDFQFNNHTPLV